MQHKLLNLLNFVWPNTAILFISETDEPNKCVVTKIQVCVCVLQEKLRSKLHFLSTASLDYFGFVEIFGKSNPTQKKYRRAV